MILFLDFDGVLHPDPCREAGRLFERAPCLAELLADFPEVGVVLSTSWRQHMTIDELVAPLPAALRSVVVGVNPSFNQFRAPARLMPYPRQAECEHWLQQNRAAEREWLALDDRSSWFEPYSNRLVSCDAATGFDDAAAGRLRSALSWARGRMMLAGVDAVV